MNKIRQVLALREGGNVRRAHTIPHQGDYTVGKHSFDMVCLVFALNPEPSVELIRACILHDIPERWVGDIPATAKWYSIQLGAAATQAEESVQKAWNLEYQLNEEDASWLHAVDRLEFFLWCHDQLQSGNQHVRTSKESVENWFVKNWDKLPLPVRELLDNFEWTRLPELNSCEELL